MALGIGYATYAQTLDTKPMSTKAPDAKLLMEPPMTNPSVVTEDGADQNMKSTDAGTFIQIGASGNAYSVLYQGRTILWADPVLNSVSMTHRMLGGTEVEGNSRVAYDLSTDGGATWQNNNQIYTPTGPDAGTGYPDNAGRYPQGAILNPAGNTDPASA